MKSYLDDRVGISDGPSVRGVEVGNVLIPSLHSADTAQLVLGLLVCDPAKQELGIRHMEGSII